MGVFKRVGLRSIRLPTLRFRGKIVLGFAVTLAISAASMGFAYLGFEHVSEGVAAYRKSVTEADLARNIDRELLAYRSAVKYFVVTGKEDDDKQLLRRTSGQRKLGIFRPDEISQEGSEGDTVLGQLPIGDDSLVDGEIPA